MALVNLQVFNDYLRDATIEAVAQMVYKFNGASAGAITLSTEGFSGDLLLKSMFSNLGAARRRVDRYATNTSASSTPLAQIRGDLVKVAGGFGPIAWEPASLTWISQNQSQAIALISENLAQEILRDMLNTGIAAAVAAMENVGATVTYDTGTGRDLTYTDLNNAHALFGDASQRIVANVMNGATYHKFIGQNLANTAELFRAGDVTVIDVLNKLIVVTDAPALQETPATSTNDIKVLGLVSGGIVCANAGDLVTNLETTNGRQRIETTMQADYSYGLGLKGYTWNPAVVSPTDAELGTGSNWTKTATSVKDTAGVLALTQAA